MGFSRWGEHSASANIENALGGLAEYTAVQTLAINRAQASGAGRKAAGGRPRPASRPGIDAFVVQCAMRPASRRCHPARARTCATRDPM